MTAIGEVQQAESIVEFEGQTLIRTSVRTRCDLCGHAETKRAFCAVSNETLELAQ